MKKDYVYYPMMFLCTIIGLGIGGSMSTQSTTNSTLKLCNEKPLECKFKYDIIKYNETGQVPYKEVKEEKEQVKK